MKLRIFFVVYTVFILLIFLFWSVGNVMFVLNGLVCNSVGLYSVEVENYLFCSDSPFFVGWILCRFCSARSLVTYRKSKFGATPLLGAFSWELVGVFVRNTR